MYELVQVGEQSYYINSPAKIGVYLAGSSEAYLIDSGNDKDAGKKVKKIFDQKNWQLKAIINTHSNADHIGGNQYLQKQTGCDIYACGIEAAFTRYPILEPAFLYGGYPCKDIRHKFLLAAESEVKDITDQGFPKELEILDLPGHFFQMIGIRTPDNSVFLADCFSSLDTLNKYKISFIYDVGKYLETLNLLETIKASEFIPAHAEATKNIKPLVDENRKMVMEISEKLLEICTRPIQFEEILQIIFTDYELTMTFEQYVLVGSTIRSYLSWLRDTDKLEVRFDNNTLLWRSV